MTRLQIGRTFIALSLAAVLTAELAIAQANTRSAPQGGPQVSASPAPAAVGGKKVLSIADYTRWRNIEGAQISGDGKWVTYILRFANTAPADAKPVLHLLNLENDRDVEIPNATGAQFSPDSRWVAWLIEPPAGGGRGGRGGRGGGAGGGDSTTPPPGAAPGVTPPAPGAPGAPAVAPVPGTDAGRGRGGATPPPAQRRLELRELATGRTQSWQDIQSLTFSPTSTHLLMRRRAAGGGGAGGAGGGAAGGGAPGGGGGGGGGAAPAAAAPAGPRGVDVILHNLASGRSQFFGSVGDASFNDKGDLLAYTVDATARDGNGLFVLDLQPNRMHVLDNDARIYSRMVWTDDGAGLAVLKGREVERMRERENIVVAFPDVRTALADGGPAPIILDPSSSAGFPKGWVIPDRGALSWSEDKKRLFVNVVAQSPAPDTSRRRGTDEQADVDVWRTQDERIQSVQMTRATADRNFTYRGAFEVASTKYVQLTDSTMRDIEIGDVGIWAVGRDTRGYISDYERPRADIYRVNTTTGERTLMMKGALAGSHLFGMSYNGRYFLYWKDNKFQAWDLDANVSRTLGNGAAANFVNLEFDHPGPKPSYGITGYTSDGKNVIVQNRYDLWLFPLDGVGPARSLTNGAGTKTETRYRLVRTSSIEPRGSSRGDGLGEGIDLSKPVTLSAYGEYTKKSGFVELANGQLRELVYEDASFSTPNKAEKADKYLFTRQTFVEFPDLRVSGPALRDAKKITNANPHQSEFVWGKRVLFDYKNKDGVRLQGILALPDDYKPGEKRPMIVTFYEKNSQNMHRYSSPSFITGMGAMPIEAVSRGYITMLPDVHFRTGSSHSDMLECVEAATKKVIEMGYVDPKRIGVHGHSYGGEGAAFIGTRSKMFAAVGMGAGVTDLFSDFSQSWGWSYQVSGGSGANGNDYYLFGQGRWGFSPWEKPEVYHYESALTHVPNVTAPFLIMHGTADPTVSFTEGMNFYNALRYNGKNAIMLAYPGEGHGLRGLANRKDLTIRYFQFFDHYLKGAPAPKWMTDGVPYLVKDTVREPG